MSHLASTKTQSPQSLGCLIVLHIALQIYWLDIDYLKTAEAALHCSASMTALLYVEEWFKEVHGQLIMGSDAQLSDEVEHAQ